MNSLGRRNVALLIESSRSYGRSLLKGIARYSRTLGNWSLMYEEMTIDSELPGWLAESHVEGVIGRVDDHVVEPLRRLGVPVVDVRCRRKYEGIPQVEIDDRAVAELAFDHLRRCGFQRLAFCGYDGAHFSDHRLQRFKELAEAESLPLEVYNTGGTEAKSLTSIERAGVRDSGGLTNWLSQLSPPTGLFVCNDIRGQQVLNVCRNMNVSIPDDIAVIGVDDDEAICLLSDPALSSVRPNAEEVGYTAGEVLDNMMHGHTAPSRIDHIAPLGVTQRLSSQVVASDDRSVARACRFIRENACSGINVKDVAEFSELSRRQLERRFSHEMGRTLHEEITLVQIDKVKQLLRETSLTLEKIAPLAGYSHKERLSSVFRRETTLTPGQYRKLNQQYRDDSPD